MQWGMDTNVTQICKDWAPPDDIRMLEMHTCMEVTVDGSSLAPSLTVLALKRGMNSSKGSCTSCHSPALVSKLLQDRSWHVRAKLLTCSWRTAQSWCGHKALFNPETSVLIQKHHPYTGILNSETSGDSKNEFLHCGDVVETWRGIQLIKNADTYSPWWSLSNNIHKEHISLQGLQPWLLRSFLSNKTDQMKLIRLLPQRHCQMLWSPKEWQQDGHRHLLVNRSKKQHTAWPYPSDPSGRTSSTHTQDCALPLALGEIHVTQPFICMLSCWQPPTNAMGMHSKTMHIWIQ